MSSFDAEWMKKVLLEYTDQHPDIPQLIVDYMDDELSLLAHSFDITCAIKVWRHCIALEKGVSEELIWGLFTFVTEMAVR